ncbi:MAG TPA: HAMP domain-containing sensor histidine kinase [Clostridia bacterium]|nr:HAMP domain-containing sensor histidine kinase [Clostridia bacterium]
MRIKSSIFLKLIITLIICITAFMATFIYSGKITFSISSDIDNIISAADSIFIEITRHCSDLNDYDPGNQAYINELAKYYGLQIIATDKNGIILVKSENVEENEIDIKEVKRIITKTSYQGEGYLYRFYPYDHFSRGMVNIIIRGVPKRELLYSTNGNVLLGAMQGLGVFIILFFLLTRNRIKYVRELSEGLQEISSGNLDFRVRELGNDELRFLGENINLMTGELQEKIRNEIRVEKSKNELVTNVSHDLRAPLTSIMGYVNLLREKRYQDDNQVEHYIDILHNKSFKLKQLVDDLFEYMLLNNEVKVIEQTICMNELLNQLLEELLPLCEERQLKFKTDIPANKVLVKAEPDKLARVFENILINAIRYSYDFSEINVRLLADKDYAIVEITNSCDEIPAKELPLLFERFYKVEKSRPSTEGSGLGLAIAKSIVDMHGGEISASSENNEITFTIRLKAISDKI